MTVLCWGMASDRFGRRPVLLWGPFGLSLATLGFGMSSSFSSLLIFRCLQGTFNGNIGEMLIVPSPGRIIDILTGVSKAVISEASANIWFGRQKPYVYSS
jgi:MFS family permease